MSLNEREIDQITRALSALEGGFTQKIQLPDPQKLFLEFRKPGESHRLLLCTSSQVTRLHLTEQRLPSPPKPIPFQSLLRARILGARLECIKQLPDERAVALTFQSSQAHYQLIAELTGRHGNLFLLDEQGSVLGRAMPSSSMKRALRVGASYQPPLPKLEQMESTGVSRFEGLADMNTLSQAIECQYQAREDQTRIERERLIRLKPLRSELKKTLRALEKARLDLERTNEAETAFRRGNLLKANIHLLMKGQCTIHLMEYTAQGIEEVALELDPALTPLQLIEAEFRRYRRLRSGKEKAGERVASLMSTARALEDRITEIETRTDFVALAASTDALKSAEPAQPKTTSSSALPFHEYRSLTGQRIWVGRSALHNETLTFKCAKGNDVWLHVRGSPGSHVIVPLGRGETLHEETRRDALVLALHFSSARGEAMEVSWTQVKHVRKQKHGAPGAVTYSQEKTAFVRPDATRLKRLLDGPHDLMKPGSCP